MTAELDSPDPEQTIDAHMLPRQFHMVWLIHVLVLLYKNG